MEWVVFFLRRCLDPWRQVFPSFFLEDWVALAASENEVTAKVMHAVLVLLGLKDSCLQRKSWVEEGACVVAVSPFLCFPL